MQLSRIVEEVGAGQEIIIAKAGRPVAKLVPLKPTKKSNLAFSRASSRSGETLTRLCRTRSSKRLSKKNESSPGPGLVRPLRSACFVDGRSFRGHSYHPRLNRVLIASRGRGRTIREAKLDNGRGGPFHNSRFSRKHWSSENLLAKNEGVGTARGTGRI